ncbi:MAG: NAD(P)/FAD-dependent oxidoreductase [Myxococcales bacterium]|nr:NAD(P)/FAD-dependent oxidoreductase [Myxococcales bacterium]
MESLDCVVVGAGVVGLAVGRRLALAGRQVVVLEAEAGVGRHTSSRNSEVIHAGIYDRAGSLKARLCVAGKRALYAYLAERAVSHRRIGKLLVAVEEGEIPQLERLRAMAEANGVRDLVPLSAAELRSLEPAVRGSRALLSPSTGILDSHGLMRALQTDLEAAGGDVVLRSPVLGGRVEGGRLELELEGADPMRLRCRAVINAAGLGAPDLARAILGLDPRLVPRPYFARGHYYALGGRSPFSRLVYPMPAPDALGIHVTLDLGGRARFGPDIGWSDEPSYVFDERRASRFYDAIRRYYPALADGALRPDSVGIRPKIVPAGEPSADFVIQGPERHGVPGLVNLFGIESPGLTACLAIADEVAARLS